MPIYQVRIRVRKPRCHVTIRLTAFLVLTGLRSLVVFADDKPVPPAPVVNPVYTPALPSAPLTEAQIEAIVDRAVLRAIDQSRASTSPQAATALPPLPAPQTVNVLTYPGPFTRTVARMGERLARLGDPKVRPMTISHQATLSAVGSSPAAPSAAATLFAPVATPQGIPSPLASMQAR